VSDQQLEIVDYDPVWALSFATEAEQVSMILAPWLGGAVEHVGSTSVPGLRAKPIVDMLAPVASLEDRASMVRVLADSGWLYWPDDPNAGWRLWLLRPRPETRTHHLVVIAVDDPYVEALVAFREVLRGDAGLRDAYAELKLGLAARYESNRNAYTNAKSDFITEALRGVGVEPPERSRLPE
jgi:GrpB-like predicted nucleotidyltransferase (UPF0157 family)